MQQRCSRDDCNRWAFSGHKMCVVHLRTDVVSDSSSSSSAAKASVRRVLSTLKNNIHTYKNHINQQKRRRRRRRDNNTSWIRKDMKASTLPPDTIVQSKPSKPQRRLSHLSPTELPTLSLKSSSSNRLPAHRRVSKLVASSPTTRHRKSGGLALFMRSISDESEEKEEEEEQEFSMESPPPPELEAQDTMDFLASVRPPLPLGTFHISLFRKITHSLISKKQIHPHHHSMTTRMISWKLHLHHHQQILVLH